MFNLNDLFRCLIIMLEERCRGLMKQKRWIYIDKIGGIQKILKVLNFTVGGYKYK